MNNPNTAVSSVGLRIATAMYQMGIDGLPRNYELVYEAYSGGNPELTREFVALGKIKTQHALDELGKKYLPHHHGDTIVSKSNAKMREKMTGFLSLLEREKSSLSSYGELVGAASRQLALAENLESNELSKSVQQLNQATVAQVHVSQSMLAEASQQAHDLEEIKEDLDNFKRMKFVDPLTGLANRRALNKALTKVYENADLPVMCGLAFAMIDDFERITGTAEKGIADQFIRHAANLMQKANKSAEFIARLDGNHFAYLIKSSDENEIMRLVDVLRLGAGSMPMVNPKTGLSLGNLTLSVGVAMSTVADGTGQLMAYAEKAMSASAKVGGNRVTFFSRTAPIGESKDWMIYRP